MNIVDHSDEEIMALANQMWQDLIKHSNEGNYAEFIKHFAPSLMARVPASARNRACICPACVQAAASD